MGAAPTRNRSRRLLSTLALAVAALPLASGAVAAPSPTGAQTSAVASATSLSIGMPGGTAAGGVFYVSELNDNDANLTGVVCDGCRMAGSTTGGAGTALSIYGSTDSGARNSIFAARRPCWVEPSASGNGPTRPVNVNNTCVTTN